MTEDEQLRQVLSEKRPFTAGEVWNLLNLSLQLLGCLENSHPDLQLLSLHLRTSVSVERSDFDTGRLPKRVK